MKSIDIANYIIDRWGENRRITVLMLNKLVYLAQVEHLRRVGVLLFDDVIEAREGGPIEPMIERAYQSFGSEAIAEPLAYVTLDDASRASVEATMEKFGTKTSLELVMCSRMPGGAWSKAYDPELDAIIYPDAIVASVDAQGVDAPSFARVTENVIASMPNALKLLENA